MNDSIGKILSKARQDAKLEIKDVSIFLKIKISDIEALEKEDFENITRHLYKPGLIKSYARMLKIEMDLIEELMKTLPFESNIKNRKYQLLNIGEEILAPNKEMFVNFALISLLFFLVMLAIYNSQESNSSRVLSTPDLVNTIEKVPE